eukprot:jgi/Mesen1/5294/ME000264S04322
MHYADFETSTEHSGGGDEDWRENLMGPTTSEPPESSESGPLGQSPTLEKTLNVVKEQMWSFGDEVLVGFGISPTILGYSEEELLEDEEGPEAARVRIQKDEVLSKSSFARRSEGNMNRRGRTDEASGSQAPEGGEEEDDKFSPTFDAEEEARALGASSSWRGSSDELDAGESGWDKKDK